MCEGTDLICLAVGKPASIAVLKAIPAARAMSMWSQRALQRRVFYLLPLLAACAMSICQAHGRAGRTTNVFLQAPCTQGEQLEIPMIVRVISFKLVARRASSSNCTCMMRCLSDPRPCDPCQVKVVELQETACLSFQDEKWFKGSSRPRMTMHVRSSCIYVYGVQWHIHMRMHA